MKYLDEKDIYLVDKKKDLSSFINELNEYCKNNQEDREHVEQYDMETARDIVLYNKPKNEKDALLYAASLNLLNTYVKKANNTTGERITYFFKGYVSNVLLRSIIDNEIDCDLFLTYDNNMTVCYVDIKGMIFSFHQVYLPEDYKEKILNYKNYKEIYFDGIRKQMVSVTIFKNVLNYCKK